MISGNEPIGGGDINEKERIYKKGNLHNEKNPAVNYSKDADATKGFNPEQILSHILHAHVGLDRYPSYLSRWNLRDITSLETALEKSVAEVRVQKRAIQERRDGIKRVVQKVMEREEFSDMRSLIHPPNSWEDVRKVILDSNLSKAVFKSKFFSRSKEEVTVADVIDGKKNVELDPEFLEKLIDQEMFDIYSFPLLSKKFCTLIVKFIRGVVKLAEENEEYSHLGIGRRVIDLDTIGLGWINDLLFHLVIRPISNHLFKEAEIHGDLDWRQGYIAGYSSTPDSKTAKTRNFLVSHTDDSEVTLNVCLGCEFEGGDLRFKGLRGTSEEGKIVGEYSPIAGKAVLHAGRHLHEVTEVTGGDRYSFILWARSWSGARSISCPCCFLNGREATTCICGPRWN